MATSIDTKQSVKNGKILSGVVVSNKMQKTVVVLVTRFVKHPKYDKYIQKIKRYKAHDEKGRQVGEKVEIREIRPMSRDKRFEVLDKQEHSD